MELDKKQKKELKRICKKYHLKMVLLFGSQISGQLNKESDIDIAVLPEKKIDFHQETMLNYELTRIFRTDKIDLVNLRTASPLLARQIIDHSKILYEIRSDIFSRYKLYVLQRYREATPLFIMHKKAIESFITT